MRFMVIVKATADSEAGKLPSPELLQAMGQYNEELAKAGVLLGGEGLLPSSRGKRVRFEGDRRTVIDGPFTATPELIAGFWLLELPSMDDAVAWVKRIPSDLAGPGVATEVEIRQASSAEDFGELQEQVPEVFERERELRAAEDARRAGA